MLRRTLLGWIDEGHHLLVLLLVHGIMKLSCALRVKIPDTISQIISMQLCIRKGFVPLDWMRSGIRAFKMYNLLIISEIIKGLYLEALFLRCSNGVLEKMVKDHLRIISLIV